MRVYICRHGEAQPHALSGRDIDRALTKKGRLQARYLASVLGSMEPASRPRRLLASPAARTMETAQSIADELGLGITTVDELLPACQASNALDAIERFSQGEQIAMVGHNPTMTAVVSVLAHGPSASSYMPGPALQTGHMAVVDIPWPCAAGTGSTLELHRYDPAPVA